MNIVKLLQKHRRVRNKTSISTERFEVILSGSGGQGMILAGKILAEAASIFDGKEAVMTQSYGPEARGGASRAEVIISSSEIDYPKVMRVNTLLVMTQEALDKYGEMLDPDGLLIVDDTFVKKVPAHFKNVFVTPFTAVAIKVFEAPIIANIVALGAVAAATKIVSRESLIRAVLARVPKKALVLNRMAVDAGYKAVKDGGYKL